VIPRYSTPEMTVVWSDTSKWARYLEVELLAAEAHAAVGVVPRDHAAACRANAPTADDAFVAAILEREQVTDHDVAAFVDVVQGAIAAGGAVDAGKWIHYGLTSSDVGDTVLCWQMTDAVDVLIDESGRLLGTLVELAHEHRHTVMIGRTHGVHAEPTTFGAKVALWALQVERDHRRLRAARDTVAVMKLSGAVGTYSNIPPEVERFVGEALGLRPVPATQVIARDRHSEFLYACASIGATCELMAVELRHLQRTEVREVQEGFKPGQKGSSAMPHKSHSSVERVVLPDSSQLAHYVMRRLGRLLAGLVVFPERMRANLDASYGLVFSQPVLLALVASGRSRDDAYRIVQRNAMRAWDEGTDFRTLLEADDEVPDDLLDDAFDLRRSLSNLDVVFAELDATDV